MKIGNTLSIRLSCPFIVGQQLAQFEIISETKGVRIGHGQGDTIAERIVAHPLDHGHNGKTDSTRFLIPDRQSNILLEWKTNIRKIGSVTLSMSVLEAGKAG